MRKGYLDPMNSDSPVKVGFALFEVCKQGHAVYWRCSGVHVGDIEMKENFVRTRSNPSRSEEGSNRKITYVHCNFSNSLLSIFLNLESLKALIRA